MKQDKVYAFQYCPCIHESGYIIMSLHRTREGAEMAMVSHKAKEKQDFYEMYPKPAIIEFGFKFGMYEDWDVKEIEILE